MPGPNGPSTPSDFEKFRREKNYRRLRQAGTTGRGEGAKKDTIREIEEGERREAIDRQLSREMSDFVEDTTRLAASVLKGVSDRHVEDVSEQITDEMKEFFRTTLRRAEEFIDAVRRQDQIDDYRSLETAVKELETTLGNLSTQELDGFRAEGSPEGQRHMGQHPLDEENPALSKRQVLDDPAMFDEVLEEGPGEQNVEAVPGDCEAGIELVGEEGSFDHCEGADVLEDPLSFGESKFEGPMAAEELQAAGPAQKPSLAVGAQPDDEPELATAPTGNAAASSSAKSKEELDALKQSLTQMVRNGLMTKDEARKVYRRAKKKS